MPFSITKHKAYELSLPKFLCDYPLKKNVPPPFDLLLSGFKCILFCGRPGSGKTSMLVSCLLDSNIFKKTFNNVIVCIPETSRNSMKKNPFKALDPSKLFDDLEDIDLILKMLDNNSQHGETTLLLIDDQQSYLKQPKISTILNHIIANRRHLKTSIIICLQTYNLLPLKTRKLVNTLVIWRPSKKEWENIAGEQLDVSQETAQEIYDYAFKKDNADGHRWMLLDCVSGRIFSMYDELIDAETKGT